MNEDNNDQQQSGEMVPVMGGSTLGQIIKAEIDSQISTAKAYPRSIDRFKKQATAMATMNEETAASCFYAVPRAGKTISGPSVRLAEICAIAWGNIRFQARVIADDGRTITAQAVCHDLENNVAGSIEVKRRVTDKKGRRFSDDMVVMTGNAACAVAKRNAILGVIPRVYVDAIAKAAKLVAIGDTKTLATKRADMIGYFAKMGIDEKRICLAVEKPSVEDIGLDELAILKGLATAIRDQETSLDEAFPEPEKAKPPEKPEPNGKSKTDQLADRLGARPEPSNEDSGQQFPTEPPGEPPAEQGGAQDEYEDIRLGLEAAKTEAEVGPWLQKITRSRNILGNLHGPLVDFASEKMKLLRPAPAGAKKARDF